MVELWISADTKRFYSVLQGMLFECVVLVFRCYYFCSSILMLLQLQ